MGGYFFPVKFCTKGYILESLHMGLVHRIDQKSSQNGHESSSNVIVLIGFLNSPQKLSKTVTNSTVADLDICFAFGTKFLLNRRPPVSNKRPPVVTVGRLL